MSKTQKLWLATVEIAGYEWRVISHTKEEAEQALWAEYKKQRRNLTVHLSTFAEFEDYFSLNGVETELNKVTFG